MFDFDFNRSKYIFVNREGEIFFFSHAWGTGRQGCADLRAG